MVEMLKKSLADDTAERAKGKYIGLVSDVALETERITTQSQAEVYFKAPKHQVEVSNKKPLPIAKAKLVNDQGVVTLETTCDTSSSESDMEIEPIPPVAVKKRVYQEIDVGSDSEEEPVMLAT